MEDLETAIIIDITGKYLIFLRFQILVALSSRGLGQVVLSHQTGVRIPVALPILKFLLDAEANPINKYIDLKRAIHTDFN
jgi:hypothetical protein